jgi:CMP-N-acetylneuraminic acid synthetase
VNILITICARGGSKGIPGKNIKLLNGKPLITYTIESAKKFQALYGADIVVSTDDDDIKDVVRNLGVLAYDRPDYLATDSAGKVETITDVLAFQENKNGKKYGYVLDLDVTSPLRTLEDLSQGFTILKNDDEAYNIYSVNLANRNPYFNMVEYKKNGFLKLCKILKKKIIRRQDAPKVYSHVAGVYALSPNFIKNKNNLMDGNCLGYEVKTECSFDIDNEHDLEIVKYFFKKNVI